MPDQLQGRRIAIIGGSGSGKTTLARVLSQRLQIPHIELDALNWGPNWTALSLADPEAWARAVAGAIAGDHWITDGNYAQGALPQILPRATDIVWLDYARGVILARVLRRSFIRALTGQELWPGTGNREQFSRWRETDHPIRWTWDTYHDANARRAALFADPNLAGARKHRLRTPQDTRRWLTQCAGPVQVRSPLRGPGP